MTKKNFGKLTGRAAAKIISNQYVKPQWEGVAYEDENIMISPFGEWGLKEGGQDISGSGSDD